MEAIIDCEVIVGGTVTVDTSALSVEDGMKAFQNIYETNPTPVNVVLCIGINDVLQGKSPEFVI